MKGLKMKTFKVIQHIRNKKDKQDLDYDFNYRWTTDIKQLEKDIKNVEDHINLVQSKEYALIEYRNPPYTVIETEQEGFTLTGIVDCDYDCEEIRLNIDSTSLLSKFYDGLNGAKVKITVEILE
jgi:hypothetical protein